MLRSVYQLKGIQLHALDGEIGKVKDVYFDDHSWAVRYLAVDTGSWLTRHGVLISPTSLGKPDPHARDIPVALTREQVDNSPDIDSDKPVNRQHEAEMVAYYGWPMYWDAPYYNLPLSTAPMGIEPASTPGASASGATAVAEAPPEALPGDPHLRSMREVIGYDIHAEGGDIGHVDDFLLDDETWAIRYMVVDTRNWLPSRRVLVAPLWVGEVSWLERKVFVNLQLEKIKDAPLYDPDRPITREYEDELYTYYGLKKYWL